MNALFQVDESSCEECGWDDLVKVSSGNELSDVECSIRCEAYLIKEQLAVSKLLSCKLHLFRLLQT